MSWNNTVTCSHCYNEGHNRRGCLKLKEYVVENPESYEARAEDRRKSRETTRSCSYCKQAGHNRKTCEPLKLDVQNASKVNSVWRENVHQYLMENGIGVGALVRYKAGWDGEMLGMVKQIVWDKATFKGKKDGYSGDFIVVTPLKDIAERGGHSIRLPEDCEDSTSENQYSGRQRILEIVSPLTASAVESQIPSDWVLGTSGIKSLFDESTQHYGPANEIKELAEHYDIQLAG
jgi:hypothetical protein